MARIGHWLKRRQIECGTSEAANISYHPRSPRQPVHVRQDEFPFYFSTRASASIHLRLSLPRRRFDTEGDGRVDLLNFLNFFLTRSCKERRSAARVTRALGAIRDDALHKQINKLKKQTVDHVDR